MENNNIDHPAHYCNGGMECIDEMLTVFGREAVKHFCLLNVWKYRKRALYKNGEEDLKKALNLRAENFSVDENMLYSIKRKIKNQRRIGMNKFKKAVIVCCTVLVIGVTGVYGREGMEKREKNEIGIHAFPYHMPVVKPVDILLPIRPP